MSISPLELRLGNLVDVINEEGIIPDTGYNWEVVGISQYCAEVFKIGQGHKTLEYSRLSPITLTEDWFIRLGFEFWGRMRGYVLYNVLDGSGNFSVSNLYKYNYTLCLDGEDVFMNEFKYVHQLQNIYFMIAGHELTIKETV